jgi:uncharacterized protein
MRDDALRARLTELNPWWRLQAAGLDPTGWTTFDRLLKDRSGYDLGYRSPVLNDLAEAPVGNTLTLLQGPRRVGKSVVLRDLVATLCARPDVDARQIISLSCDAMTAQDLTRAIKLGRDLTRSVDQLQPQPRIWLFDEITGVRGWASTLKYARDSSAFGDDTVVATGSSWRDDEDIEGNLLAGRAGTSGLRRTRQLLPMSFPEYVRLARSDIPPVAAVHIANLQTPLIRTSLEPLAFLVDELDLAWTSYLTIGGFARAVSVMERSGAHDGAFIEDLQAWLRRDVDPDGPQESLPVLLDAISRRGSSPLDRTKTAVHLGYASKATFERRLNRLVHSFAALWCPQRDERARVVAGTQAKLYLSDPILSWLPSLLRPGTPTPDFTILTEQTLGIALARAIDGLEAGRWVGGDTIGYERTGTGNEIDFTPIRIGTPAGPDRSVAIESKWVDHGWRGESRGIRAKHDGGIVATKTVLDLSNSVWAIPAPLLAMLLG